MGRKIFIATIITLGVMSFSAGYAQKKENRQSLQIMQISPKQTLLYGGTYTPDINSIRTHKCPEWFRDAKFGMFVDWGLYSVGGWAPKRINGAMYPDWYMKNMLSGETKEYHEKTWGKDFMPDDFIPLFTAENYDPEGLVALAKEAGMKYLIPFCKHHDGFCLWPSSYTERDAMDMGPRRDLVRPLVDACYRNELKFGFYFSIDEWYYPIIDKDGKKRVREWAGKIPTSKEVELKLENHVSSPNGKKGFKVTFFNNPDLKGEPVYTGYSERLNFARENGDPKPVAPGVVHNEHSARFEGTFQSPVTGEVIMKIRFDDGFRFFIDGKLIAEDFNRHTADTYTYKLNTVKGKKYALKVEYVQRELGSRIILEAYHVQPNDGKMNEKIHLTGKRPVKDFFGDYIVPQAIEFIDMYDPDILWFDGDWEMSIDEYRTPEIISHFYNKAEGRKEVALNDRNGRSRFQIGDFFCSEYHQLPAGYEFKHPWEENRGISQSFGYNWQDTEENVLSSRDFIHMFIRTVSENGNLLLIVNLDGKGALPEVQERRLRDIGKWLKINGEAIYETRPWLASVQKMEGETVKLNEGIFGGMVSESEVKDDKKKEGNAGEVRFTQSKDGKTVYAICTEFPKGELELNSLYLSSATGKVVMIGAEMTPLEWSHKPAFDRTKLVVKIPESLYNQRKNEHAWVFKITL